MLLNTRGPFPFAWRGLCLSIFTALTDRTTNRRSVFGLSNMKSIRRTENRTNDRRGVLTFEWILLISLLVIGVIGGLSAVRNSLLNELNDLDNCIQQLNTAATPSTPGNAPGIVAATAAWWETTPEVPAD